MAGPDPQKLYPYLYSPKSALPIDMQRVVFLKPLIQHPLTSVGEFTYYDDPNDPTGFERNNVLYHYGPARLQIGKFCSIAAGVRFIMSSGNHAMDGASTYPFPLIAEEWLEGREVFRDRRNRGDTVVGNDVWLGHEALVMPGVTIGDGAVVGARSVVTSDVPPYAIVGGNPARVLRMRYGPEEIERLRRIAWWDWPVDVVTANVVALMKGPVEQLERIARDNGLLPDEVAEPAGADDPRRTSVVV